jgi:cobalamin biosynthesis protein CobD/CbiB
VADIPSRVLHWITWPTSLTTMCPKRRKILSIEVAAQAEHSSKGAASTLAAGAEVLELRQIERTLKLKMERKQTEMATGAPPRRMIQNTLASWTLTVLPEEVFV